MTLIRRYLYREIFQAWVTVTLVLLLIYVGNYLVRVVSKAAAGGIAPDLILQLILLQGLVNLPSLMPFGLAVGILLALGRLYADSEIVAMSAGGIGTRKLTQSVIWLVLGGGALTAWLALSVSPRLGVLQEKLLAHAKGMAELSAIVPGRFQSFSGGDQTVYVERVDRDGRTMENVFVQLLDDDRHELLISRRAYRSNPDELADSYVVLEDGHRYAGTPGTMDYVVTEFERYAVRLDRVVDRSWGRRLEAVSTVELWYSDDLRFTSEFQWRVSLPISTVLLGLLAVPMARTTPRQGRYGRLFVASAVFFLYGNVQGIALNMVKQGELAPAIGVWPAHALLAAVIVIWVFVQTSGWWRLVSAWRRAGPRPTRTRRL